MVRKHAIMMWAKSWHTPLRCARASTAGVLISVLSASYAKSSYMRSVRSIATSKVGRPGTKLARA